MDLDFSAVLDTFFAESTEGLGVLEDALLDLENQPGSKEVLEEIFRVVHTLKGDAGMVGFSRVAALAHTMEDLLDALRQGQIAADSETVALLLEGVDALRELLRKAEMGIDEASPDHEDVVRRLASAMSLAAGGKPDSGIFQPGLQAPGALSLEEEVASRLETHHAPTLRVDVAKLDQILTLVGEIAVARGGVTQALESTTVGLKEILEQQRDADRLHMEMQELVMKLRMLPVEPVFRQYRRAVRDLSKAQGKQARLVVEGGEVELDNSVLQLLRDPLLHMVRNAIDHGIESPAVRREKGKVPIGTITLRAAHVAGKVVIEVIDDGAGLDADRILARAKRDGRLQDNGEPSEDEIHRLLFEPGFSTVEQVTELSGRGVGMDVVRRSIEAIRGSVTFSSPAGGGTCVTIRLPLTLSLIDGLLVQVADETYVVPLDAVIESLDLPSGTVSAADGRGVVNVRDRLLPYARLRELFAIPGPPAARENVIVVQLPTTEAGLVVDRVFGKIQTVIKPLSRPLQGLPGLSGTAVLGNGKVAMILDVADLLQREFNGGKLSGSLLAS